MQKPNGVGAAACASCKHQRKKCTEKCILAPFFPVEKNREFQAVHKVFGVSNIAKTLKNLNHEDRKRAADSLIWEAFCWQKDPINGPYGEHKRVFEELNLYKTQYLNQLQITRGRAAMPPPLPSVLIGWNNGSSANIDHACSYGYSGNFDQHLQNIEKQWPENNNIDHLPQQQYSIAG